MINTSVIPDDWVELIGNIVVVFSMLDREINNGIWYFLKCDEVAGSALVNSITSTSTRLRILGELAKIRLTQSEYEHFKAHMKAIDVINNYRNTLIHSIPYWWSPSTGKLGYFKHATGFNPQPPVVFTNQHLCNLRTCIFHEISFLQQVVGHLKVAGESWQTHEVFELKPIEP